ncbi:MAG: methyltransferase domain-containing protein, partial [Flavobacteriaceae bacterium]|nr:methyltransferase domain-containing protein [Flavobacteriaceae bacterium]
MDYHKLNSERFSGQQYINLYNKYRPSPPKEIIHQTLNYLNSYSVERLVDLGCGTGISTLVWNDFASEIIGIEPSKEMVLAAKEYFIFSVQLYSLAASTI